MNSDLHRWGSNGSPPRDVITPCAPRPHPSYDHKKLCVSGDSTILAWGCSRAWRKHLCAWRTRNGMHPQTLNDWPTLSWWQRLRELWCLERRWRWHRLHMPQETSVLQGGRVTCGPLQTLRLDVHAGFFGTRFRLPRCLIRKQPLSKRMLETGLLYVASYRNWNLTW